MKSSLDENAKVQLLNQAFAKKNSERLTLIVDSLLSNEHEYKFSTELLIKVQSFASKQNNFTHFLDAYKQTPLPSNLVKSILIEGGLFLDRQMNKIVLIVARDSKNNGLLCLDENGQWLDISETVFCKTYPKIAYIKIFSDGYGTFVNEFKFKGQLYSLNKGIDERLTENDKDKVMDFYLCCMRHPFYISTGIFLEVGEKLLSKLELPLLLSRVYRQENELAILLEYTQTQVRYLDKTGQLKQQRLSEFIEQSWVVVADKCLFSNTAVYYTAKVLDGLTEGYINGVNVKHKNKVGLFKEEGVLLLRNVFPEKTINNLRKQIITQFDQLIKNSMQVGGSRRMFPIEINGVLNQDQIYFNAQLQEILTDQLSDDVVINSVSLVVANKGSDYQHVHSDHSDLFSQNDATPPYAIALAIPLVDVNQQTGSTRFICATNDKRSEHQQMLFSQRKTINANVGDCHLYDYRVMHQGTPTLIDQIRPVLFIVYSRPWFREVFEYKRLAQCFMSDDEFSKVPFKHHSLFFYRSDRFNEL